MCGLFGWFIPPNEFSLDDTASMIKVLVQASTLRGQDSWGYAAPHGRKIDIVRGMGALDKGVNPRALAEVSTLFGHTRAATVGKVKLTNAHPICANHVVGAHNGGITNHAELTAKYRRHCEVDSMHLFYHIAEKRPVSELEGWGAFWYIYRGDPYKLHLARSSYGNLFMVALGEKDKPKGMLFASAWYSLMEACESIKADYHELSLTNETLCTYNRGVFEVTGKTMAFGTRNWDAWRTTRKKDYYDYDATKTPYPSRYPLLPQPKEKHLPRSERWSPYLNCNVTEACDGCGYRFFGGTLSVNFSTGRRYCVDCEVLEGGAHA